MTSHGPAGLGKPVSGHPATLFMDKRFGCHLPLLCERAGDSIYDVGAAHGPYFQIRRSDMNAIHPVNGYGAGWWRALAVAALGLACSGSVWAADDSAAADEVRSIETLLKGGWEIAGYVSTGDNRTSLTLFKHAGETYLVQCLTGYDVTRTPRVHTHCYKLR